MKKLQFLNESNALDTQSNFPKPSVARTSSPEQIADFVPEPRSGREFT
jgi:hypothetical protein